MGWWESTTLEKGKLIIGDGPADILGTAYESIVRLYEKEVGRKPRRAELQKLVRFTLPPFLAYELDED